jgi:transcription termination/antitermination protein NusG
LDCSWEPVKDWLSANKAPTSGVGSKFRSRIDIIRAAQKLMHTTAVETSKREVDIEQDSTRWFAVRVKSNRENVVVSSLSGKGYETFLPTYSWPNLNNSLSGRPLFPGYVFCRFNVTRRLPILLLPAVVHIVGIGRTPIAIDDEEIASLRLAVESRLPMAEVDYRTGERVQVDKGPLAGATGTISGRTCDRFVVSITLLQRSVAVELRPEWLARPASWSII